LKPGVQLNVPVLSPLSTKLEPVGEPMAVSVTWSPSGSVAETPKVRRTPSSVVWLAGAVTVGFWFWLPTVTVVAAEPERAFDAVNVTVYVPACVVVGVHANVPEVFEAFAVNVLPVVAGEEAAVNDAIASPSGSAADTVKLPATPSLKDAVAGAVTTGARSTLFTVIAVEAEPERAFDAVNVTV
jgi:hypothetical protein